MVVEICADAEAVGRRVADLLCATVRHHPHAVLGLPTGSTPLPTYRELARRVAAGTLDATGVRVVILDEYVGLAPDDPRSYRATIRREATQPLGVPDALVFGPAGEAADPDAAAADYEALIASMGGVDLQVVGIGRNGHVAFNEPGTPLDARTHVARLSEVTRADNAAFFGADEVPTRAITQGPATIGAARRLALVATGAAKAAAVAAALAGPVSSACPASLVQRHPDVLVVLDGDAAQLLDHRGSGVSSEGGDGS